MTDDSLSFDQSDTVKIFITRNPNTENEYSLSTVFKWRAEKKYDDLPEIIRYLDESINLSSNNEVRKIFIEAGFQELLNIFDSTKSLVLEIKSLKTTSISNEVKLAKLQKDFKNIVSQTSDSIVLEQKNKFRIYGSDEKWSYADEDKYYDWISLGSFYCQWNIDNGYLRLDLARSDCSAWVLKVEYPEVDDFGEKREGRKLFIQSETLDGILSYVQKETALDFWEFVKSLIDLDRDDSDLIKLRKLNVISDTTPTG
tara:strand:- start:20 stop:787 length:768 start_codon:yes stop_codon:yes gene_type:complete